MSPRVVQALIRRQDDGYLAECVEYPVGREAETLSEAMSGIEDAIRTYLRKRGEDEEFLLLISCYFGRFSVAEF
jgi:predicted RNase H-like HicB family nuclease